MSEASKRRHFQRVLEGKEERKVSLWKMDPLGIVRPVGKPQLHGNLTPVVWQTDSYKYIVCPSFWTKTDVLAELKK